MKTIYNGKGATIKWKVLRTVNKISEDFTGSNIKMFLIGTNDTYAIPNVTVKNEGGYQILYATIPSAIRKVDTNGNSYNEPIARGVYDLKVIWVKSHLSDDESLVNAQFANISRMSGYIAMVDNEMESNAPDGVVSVCSFVESYGRDGLTAYEIAVLRGVNGGADSELDWVSRESVRNHYENMRKEAEISRENSEAARVSAEEQRISAEEERVGEWNSIKDSFNGNFDGYQYLGTATPDTIPSPLYTQKVYYDAVESGKYVNFENIVVNRGEYAALMFDGTKWKKVLSPSEVFFRKNTMLMRNPSDEYAKLLSKALLGVNIKGLPKDRKLIVSRFSQLSYDGYYLVIRIADITDGTIEEIASFSKTSSDVNSVEIIPVSTVSSKDVYEASLCVDREVIGTKIFNGFTITSYSDDLYDKYGIIPPISDTRHISSPLVGSSIPMRQKRMILDFGIKNLDLTREYVAKSIAFDQSNRMLTIQLSTTENKLTAYTYQVIIPSSLTGVKKLYNANRSMYAVIDIDLATSKYNYGGTFDSYSYEEYGVSPKLFSQDESIEAMEEIELTLDGEPMKLQDCGQVTGLFYLTCGRKILTTNSITKEGYALDDIGRSLTLVYEFADNEWNTGNSRAKIGGVNTIKELNSGRLLVNVCIDYYEAEGSENYMSFSSFFMYDGQAMVKCFDGSWQYHTLSSGVVVRRGGFWTGIWDLSEYNNLVFVTERNNQGLGGRVWMSKDFGATWYVIFNAFTNNSGDLYKAVQPSGWDNTIPDKPDFMRPVPGTSTYPNGSCFHVHGVTYDQWRDQVIVVSGDAGYEKGSYSAVWILKSPEKCEVYPASGDIPEGGTASATAPKMLKCNWVRIGLFGDETKVGEDYLAEGLSTKVGLQFVSSIVFPDVVSFGSDCGGGGLNGVINNTFPSNIVGSGFRVAYPLNSDIEKKITHCASGALRLKGRPVLWVFHREGSGFDPATSSDQLGAILSSYDGKTWKRVWVDDTLDEERKTKVSWGSTLIGKEGELYLRYRGFDLNDNVIRRMVLR